MQKEMLNTANHHFHVFADDKQLQKYSDEKLKKAEKKEELRLNKEYMIEKFILLICSRLQRQK